MAKQSKILVTGIKELDKAIEQFEATFVLKSIRKVLRKTQKEEIQKELKNNIPVDRGILKKNIKIKAQKRSTKSVGVDTQIIDTPHAVAVEFGHGSAQPDMTWRTTFDNKKESAKNNIEKDIMKQIDEDVKKAARKNK